MNIFEEKVLKKFVPTSEEALGEWGGGFCKKRGAHIAEMIYNCYYSAHIITIIYNCYYSAHIITIIYNCY
jgi:hypothetical protein